MGNIASPSHRRDRRIALVKPRDAQDAKAAHAMQLLSSMLWAFRGTTRSAWETVPPDDADVVVFHIEDDKDSRVADWQASGKLAVQIYTNPRTTPASRHALIYPFRAAQAFALLEQLDSELQSSESARGGATDDAPAAERVILKAERWAFVEKLESLRAQRNAQTWSVAYGDSGPLVWIKSGGAAYFAESATVLAIRNGTLRLDRLRLGPPHSPPGSDSLKPESELSWFAAGHASPRLIEGLSDTTHYRLARWPDFGSIRPPRSQLRATAVLTCQSVTAAELAARARITLEEANRTLNALAVHGLLTSTLPEAHEAATERTSGAPAFKGLAVLLHKVRQRLGLGD